MSNIIKPTEEFEQRHQGKLVNVVKHDNNLSSDTTRTLSPDQLDAADKTARQQANALLAEAQLKELPNRNDISDTPYVHTSTYGFGAWSQGMWDLFPNNRSQRVLTVFLIAAAVIGGGIKLATYLL